MNFTLQKVFKNTSKTKIYRKTYLTSEIEETTAKIKYSRTAIKFGGREAQTSNKGKLVPPDIITDYKVLQLKY